MWQELSHTRAHGRAIVAGPNSHSGLMCGAVFVVTVMFAVFTAAAGSSCCSLFVIVVVAIVTAVIHHSITKMRSHRSGEQIAV